MSFAEGREGYNLLGPNATKEIRLGRTGAQIVADAHARYAEACSRGRLMVAHNVAAQAVSVALTAVYTGLCISNKIGNNKHLSLLGVGFALTVAPAAIASLHVLSGFSATVDVVHTTPLAAPGPRNCLIGVGAPPTALADSAATIVNPTYLHPLMGGFTAAALPASPLVWCDIGGLYTFPPGAWFALGALTAVTGFAAFVWEELDAAAVAGQ